MAGQFLVGDALVDALEDALDRHPAANDIPDLSYFDGALAGMLLLPESIPPEEWQPSLYLGQDHGDWDGRDRLIELLTQRQAEIAAHLLEGGLAFAPVYMIDIDGAAIWEPWLMGILGAVRLRPEQFERLIASEDEDVGTSLLGLLSLAATLPDLEGAVPDDMDLIPPEDLDVLAETARDMIPYFVETIYRRTRGLDRAIIDDVFYSESSALPVHRPKIGRNEPCPCGSGKKYKRCCLA
jgi:uncharacterized protein